MNDYEHAAIWARNLLAQDDVVILDTETTGLHGDAEIVQIAIITSAGQELLNTFVKPTRPIPRDAQRIHGITDERVANAPTFDSLAPLLCELLSGMTVVIYNADYDTRLMEQSLAPYHVPFAVPIFGADAYVDAMEMYSQWVGDWSNYHHNYRWQRLPGGDHSAIGDARATLEVIKRMAETPISNPDEAPTPEHDF